MSSPMMPTASALRWLPDRLRRLAPPSLTQLTLRIALAVPFLKSGLLKWDGFLSLGDTAIYLFTEEFRLHLPGGPYPFPAPAAVAFLSAAAETALPVLLVIGLGTRLAAAALLVMTAVIQLTVPEGWPIHLTWAAMALALVTYGPGRIALDALLPRAVAAPRFSPELPSRPGSA